MHYSSFILYSGAGHGSFRSAAATFYDSHPHFSPLSSPMSAIPRSDLPRPLDVPARGSQSCGGNDSPEYFFPIICYGYIGPGNVQPRFEKSTRVHTSHTLPSRGRIRSELPSPDRIFYRSKRYTGWVGGWWWRYGWEKEVISRGKVDSELLLNQASAWEVKRKQEICYAILISSGRVDSPCCPLCSDYRCTSGRRSVAWMLR